MSAEHSEWTRLLEVSALPPGKGRFIAAGGCELAVFHIAESGQFAVIDNSCPHAGGNLSAGSVANGAVTCPWHQWEFDLASGVCTTSDRVCVRRYAWRVEAGVLYARLTG